MDIILYGISHSDGKMDFINVRQISSIRSHEGNEFVRTKIIMTGGEVYSVQQTPEEVGRAIVAFVAAVKKAQRDREQPQYQGFILPGPETKQ